MSTNSQPLSFTKGHGTGNDFVIILDRDGDIELTPERVAQICDRHFGVGADGVLRVVPARFVADSSSDPADNLWFMDYRNADGSVAEMCGNGARVFAKFLQTKSLVEAGDEGQELSFESRAGVHQARFAGELVGVGMGFPAEGPAGPSGGTSSAVVSVGQNHWPATAWWMPNPHAVVLVEGLEDAGSLLDSPEVDSEGLFPDGQNVEFMVDTSASNSELSAAIRIFERGVGETLSCGTGACAAALALRERHGVTEPGDVAITVPGGELTVQVDQKGQVWLIGPTKFVAEGTLAV